MTRLPPLVLAALALAAAPAWADLPPASDLVWSGGAGVTVEKGGGVTLEMGDERVNWNHARWAVAELGEPVDLSGSNALRLTVSTNTPRRDAGVYIAVRESDGSWYYQAWATDLTQKMNTGTAYFSDFRPAEWVGPTGGPAGHFDENNRLDLAKIDAIAIGCINPLGIGEVAFNLASIQAVQADDPYAADPDAPIPVHVTGKLLSINGTETLPAGVFGSFNLKDMTVGQPTVEVDGKTYPVNDGSVEIDGNTFKVEKGRIKIDGKTHKVEATTVSRTEHYRLAQDKRIDHGGGGGDVAMGTDKVPMMINSIGDRTAPPVYLTNPKWREQYQAAGKKVGEAAKASDHKVYVEYWNEPYLNWANINRKGFDPGKYNVDEAKEGGEVKSRATGETMPHLAWTRDPDAPLYKWYDDRQQFRRGVDEKGGWTLPYAMPYSDWYPGKWRAAAAELNPPDEIKDGEKYTAKNGREYTATTPWTVYDQTQFTHWSGQGMLKPYIDPMVVYGKALKEAGDGEVVYIVGWGMRPSEDHWAAWDMLYKPTIDAGIEYIDGVNEHDYGGLPEKMPAVHEVVTAYGQTAHGKWLYSFNTESGLSTDPQAYPAASAAGGDAADEGAKKAQADRAKFEWITQKILATLEETPDKTRAISHFGVGGQWFSDEGEGVALNMLKPLRGRMVQVIENDPDLYAVASIDGTDPQSPRPADMGAGNELVIAVFNGGDRNRAISLTVDPPAGVDALNLQAQVSSTEATSPASQPLDFDEMLKRSGGLDVKEVEIGIEPGQLMVLRSMLSESAAADRPADVNRQQFFGNAILQEVTPDAPLTQMIALDPAVLKGGRRAWVRIVAERLGRGEGVVTLNGKAYRLPPAITPETTPKIVTLSIPIEELKASNTLEYRTSTEHDAGYLLAMNSLVVEGE